MQLRAERNPADPAEPGPDQSELPEGGLFTGLKVPAGFALAIVVLVEVACLVTLVILATTL